MTKALTAPIEELFPNPWNTNIVSPENEQKLDAALKRFGFFKPIIVRDREWASGYEILGGEHRWEAAKRIGLTEVPIFSLGVMDDQRAKEISLADNARYGADDTIQLAELLQEIGGEQIQDYLPYSDVDIKAIFASVDIAFSELELDEKFDAPEEKAEELPSAKAPKTHTIMRFKIPLGDAERITALIAKIQKRHGYSSGDELTNAGDALVHLLFASEAEADA